MSVFTLMGVPGLIRKVVNYLELNGMDSNIVANNLDATVSSRATATSVSSLTSDVAAIHADLPGGKPLILKEQRFDASGTWNVPTGIMGRQVFLTGVGGGSSGGRSHDYTSYSAGGAGMACMALPMTLLPGITSVAITVGAGGAAPTQDGDYGDIGSSTYFGNFLRIRGAGQDLTSYMRGADHYGLANLEHGYRNGFFISGGDGGSAGGHSGKDCKDTGYKGGEAFGNNVSGGGASAFADGGDNSSRDGTLGSGGAGVRDTYVAGKGGDGFLIVQWFEQLP